MRMLSVRNIAISVSATMMLLSASCFTGIESTPRITAADVRDAGAGTTAEQTFCSVIRGEMPSSWQPGKQWLVDDNKVAIIFNPPTTDNLKGHVLTLGAVGSTPTVMGDRGLELVFESDSAATYVYQPGISIGDLADRFTLSIPFTIELSAVAKADSLLRGNTYYINTPVWRDATGRTIDGLRHVPVRVTSVTPGTYLRPLCVNFVSEANADTCSILLTYGNSTSSTRNFDKVFSFNNPRVDYPRISDHTWNNIVHSHVEEGMTRDECRLALGVPTSLRRGATTADRKSVV